MYNHNKAQQSKNRVHISLDILYVYLIISGMVVIVLMACIYKTGISYSICFVESYVNIMLTPCGLMMP